MINQANNDSNIHENKDCNNITNSNIIYDYDLFITQCLHILLTIKEKDH